jgi:hypothetical protein
MRIITLRNNKNTNTSLQGNYRNNTFRNSNSFLTAHGSSFYWLREFAAEIRVSGPHYSSSSTKLHHLLPSPCCNCVTWRSTMKHPAAKRKLALLLRSCPEGYEPDHNYTSAYPPAWTLSPVFCIVLTANFTLHTPESQDSLQLFCVTYNNSQCKTVICLCVLI